MYFLITLVFISCGTKKAIAPEQIIPENNPKLLFINYSVQKTENGKRVTLINKRVTDGKLKNSGQKFTKYPTVDDLKCSQLDKDSFELKTVYVKNPLVKIVEALDDSLSFSAQKIEQNKTPLSLRLQLHPQAEFITLSNIIDSLQNTIELIKVPLK